MSIRLYVAAMYGVAAVVAAGVADAMSTRAYDESAGGQLEVQLPDGFANAEVLHTDVEARIRDGVAEIRMRQLFSGVEGQAQAATYLLPLGQGADVVAIEVAEGSRIERKVISDFMPVTGSGAPRMFSQELNLSGASPVEITLTYIQPVPVAGDTHSLVLPIAMLPGGKVDDPLFEVAGLSAEYADLPEYLCGELMVPDALGLDRVTVSVSIDHASLAGIYSDTHEIDVTAVPGGRMIELSRSGPVANRSFVLDYVPAGPKPENGITVVAHADGSR